MEIKKVVKWTLLHATPLGIHIQAGKRIYSEFSGAVDGYLEDGTLIGAGKGLIKGYTKCINNEIHDTLENSPLTAPIYSYAKKDGEYEGTIKGYNETSKNYEKKFNDQEERFKKEQEKSQKQFDEYEQFIKEFEEKIKNNS